jgi:small subunit ribosomal protein S20
VANIKSAAKRIGIAERNRLRNKSYKSAVKTLIKRYHSAVTEYTAEPSSERLDVVKASMSAAYSKIDKAVKRGAIHSNTGARRKALLAKLYKQVDAPTSVA